MPNTTTSRFIAAAGAWTRAAAGIAAALCSLGAAASVPARPPTPPGWFHIIPIDAHTYAISEPKYLQEEVSHLLISSPRGPVFCNRARDFNSLPGSAGP